MNTRRYDAQTQMITTEIAPGIVSQAHLRDFHCRWWVMDHISNHAPFAQLVTPEMQQHLYNDLADGFGEGTPPTDEDGRVYFDWSHFRDSSRQAFERMADYLAREIWAERDSYAQVYAQFKRDLAMVQRSDHRFHVLDWFK